MDEVRCCKADLQSTVRSCQLTPESVSWLCSLQAWGNHQWHQMARFWISANIDIVGCLCYVHSFGTRSTSGNSNILLLNTICLGNGALQLQQYVLCGSTTAKIVLFLQSLRCALLSSSSHQQMLHQSLLICFFTCCFLVVVSVIGAFDDLRLEQQTAVSIFSTISTLVLIFQVFHGGPSAASASAVASLCQQAGYGQTPFQNPPRVEEVVTGPPRSFPLKLMHSGRY